MKIVDRRHALASLIHLPMLAAVSMTDSTQLTVVLKSGGGSLEKVILQAGRADSGLSHRPVPNRYRKSIPNVRTDGSTCTPL
jgi:hypothetical protein